MSILGFLMKMQPEVVFQEDFATFATSCDPLASRKNLVKLVNKLNDFWSPIVPFYPLRPVLYFLFKSVIINILTHIESQTYEEKKT